MRFCSTRERLRLSRISPQLPSRKAMTNIPVATTALGRRGTSPVCIHVTMTGNISTAPAMAKSAAKMA